MRVNANLLKWLLAALGLASLVVSFQNCDNVGFNAVSISSTQCLNSDSALACTPGENQGRSSPGWYNTSWGVRKPITITGSDSGAQTNYQIKITLAYDSDMQADFDDIRFTDSDGSTLIDHWLESKTNSATADFWVEVPNIPALPSATVVYAYYGNSGASSVSSGDNTFVFFDDFINTDTHQFAYGSDSGYMSGFDPNTRRFYFLGAVADDLTDFNITTWANIDTWDVGFGYPSMTISNASVIYNPNDKKFYTYGGTDGGVPINKVYSFDPVTKVVTLLPITLPEALTNPEAVFDPVSGKVFLFGGRKTFSGNTSTFTDKIYVHNLDFGTPTITDTTAVLSVASEGMAPVYSLEDEKIYLFGGAYNNGGSALNSLTGIFSYDPADPSVNPVDTLADLPTGRDTMGTAYANGSVYIFGGYNWTTSTYFNTIYKYDISSNNLSTLATTMYKTDDDMKAFYDSTTDQIYVGPLLHSTGTSNEDERKVVILEFDPNTETLAAEPSLGAVPTSWTSEGTASTDTPRYVGNEYMSLSDHHNTASGNTYVAAQRIFPALSGVVMAEYKVSVANSIDNIQFYLGPSGINFFFNAAVNIRSSNGTDWRLLTSNDGSTNQPIASIQNGNQIIGALIDIPNAKQYGLVNRMSKTAQFDWLNPVAALTTTFINTSASHAGAVLIDWMIIRKSVTGSDPISVVGSETMLYASDNSTIYPNASQNFTTPSRFSEIVEYK